MCVQNTCAPKIYRQTKKTSSTSNYKQSLKLFEPVEKRSLGTMLPVDRTEHAYETGPFY